MGMGISRPERQPRRHHRALGPLAGDFQVVNLDDSLSLRDALEEPLAALNVDDAADAIDGYHRSLPGLESSARSVAAGRADVGLGILVTAKRLGLGFVPVGTQTLGIEGNSRLTSKFSVDRLGHRLADRLPSLLSESPGYASAE